MSRVHEIPKEDLLYTYAVEALAGKPYILGADGPAAYDCSSAVCHGIRTVCGKFGDYTAHDLRRKFTTQLLRKEELRRGSLIFYDYTQDGRIDHVTTVLDDKRMLHPSSGSGKLLIVSLTYLDHYTHSRGGAIYYAQIDWNAARNG